MQIKSLGQALGFQKSKLWIYALDCVCMCSAFFLSLRQGLRVQKLSITQSTLPVHTRIYIYIRTLYISSSVAVRQWSTTNVLERAKLKCAACKGKHVDVLRYRNDDDDQDQCVAVVLYIGEVFGGRGSAISSPRHRPDETRSGGTNS